MGKKDIKKDHLKDFWIDQQGKDFIQYPGLLAEFHRLNDEWMAAHPVAHDQRGIGATLIQIPSADNDMTAVAAGEVTMSSGARYTEIGDANPNNTNRMVAKALMRMAATRAKGRALRDATNIGVTMYEELEDAIPTDDDSVFEGDDASQAQNHGAKVRPASKTQLDQIKSLATDLGEAVVVPSDLDEPGAEAMISQLRVKLQLQHQDLYTEISGLIPQYAKASGKKDADVVATLKSVAKIDKAKKLGEGTLPQLRKALEALQNMMTSEAA